MTIQEVANRMNWREYLQEITSEEEKELKEAGIVVAFGYSDDNVELRGALDEEIGGCDEFGINFFMGELFSAPCLDYGCEVDIDGCPLYKAMKPHLHFIQVSFSENGWKFETEIPHEEFYIVEDGEVYGQGIAFYLKDIGGGA